MGAWYASSSQRKPATATTAGQCVAPSTGSSADIGSPLTLARSQAPTRASVANGLSARHTSPSRNDTNWIPTQKVMNTAIGAMLAAGNSVPNRPAVTTTV